MTRRWAPELETAARWLSPYAVADDRSSVHPSIRSALDRLASMPAQCEQCGHGRPVCLLDEDGQATAICASCRDAATRAWRQAGVRRQLLADAGVMTTALDAQTQRGMRARRLIGYVAVFGQSYRRRDGSEEVVESGAFQRALRRGGLTLRVNHDPQRVIARQNDGTLRLCEDAFGLRLEADVDSRARRLLVEAERGELRGSFAGALDARWSQPPLRRRTVHAVALTELSVITRARRAAYQQTWLGLDTDAYRRRVARAQHDALDRLISDVEIAC